MGDHFWFQSINTAGTHLTLIIESTIPLITFSLNFISPSLSFYKFLSIVLTVFGLLLFMVEDENYI